VLTLFIEDEIDAGRENPSAHAQTLIGYSLVMVIVAHERLVKNEEAYDAIPSLPDFQTMPVVQNFLATQGVSHQPGMTIDWVWHHDELRTHIREWLMRRTGPLCQKNGITVDELKNAAANFYCTCSPSQLHSIRNLMKHNTCLKLSGKQKRVPKTIEITDVVSCSLHPNPLLP
jgi:hypothetical protein